MWPLDNQRQRARNRDQEVYIPLQEKMLHRWMQQENVDKLPPDFTGYLAFVSRTLEDNQKKRRDRHEVRSGLFPLDKIRRPTPEQAEDVYQRFVNGGIPSEQEYRTFRIMFPVLSARGGRLHLPVHVHSAVGIGDYFNLSEGNIMNLENILRDPAIQVRCCNDPRRLPTSIRRSGWRR